MNTFSWYALAALGEIAGCFTFWMWLRQSRTPLWILPGICALAFFAFALTRIEAANAGRAFAAYGGIYILSSLLWMWSVERKQPDRWDLLGAMICLAGSALILYGPRPK